MPPGSPFVIRVTGGEFAGRKLKTASGVGTRPSTGRLRAALFSILGDRVVGANVADLFAGSGSLGIEAIGRGASSAEFVEIDGKALKALGENLDLLRLSPPRARIRRGDARRWIARVAKAEPPPTPWMIFLDPPYTEEIVVELLPRCIALLESGRASMVLMEHDIAAELPDFLEFPGLHFRSYDYGRSAFTLVEKEAI